MHTPPSTRLHTSTTPYPHPRITIHWSSAPVRSRADDPPRLGASHTVAALYSVGCRSLPLPHRMGPALGRPVVRPRPRSRMAMPRVLVREGLRGPADQHGPHTRRRTQAAQVPRGRLRLAGRYRRADGALRLSPLGVGQRAAEQSDGLAEALEPIPELLQPPDGGALGGRTADVLRQPAEVRLLAGLVVVSCSRQVEPVEAEDGGGAVVAYEACVLRLVGFTLSLVGEDESIAEDVVAHGLHRLVALQELGRPAPRRPRELPEAQLLRRKAEGVGVGAQRLAAPRHDLENPHARL